MKTVSLFEANLLRILHCLLRRAPLGQFQPLLMEACEQPPCLSRSATELVQETLAKGCVLLLSQGGGWRRERHLRGERIVEGRLWERTPPTELGLSFSRHSLSFLVWLTAVKLEDGKTAWKPPVAKLTLGDWLFLYFAFDMVAGMKMAPLLAPSPAFSRNALCRLAHPQEFARMAEADPPDFVPWTTDLGACILEALQPRLADSVTAAERRKGEIERWEAMRAVGRAQERALQAFLEATEKAGRKDLTRFLLEACAELLPENAAAEQWTGRLTSAGQRLADRTETYRAALALLHQLGTLQRWTLEARTVGYLDEGYAASQLWKADWERCQGDVLCSRAEAVIRQLDPMTQTRSQP